MAAGCLAGTIINLLPYADDVVVLAPCWQALQSILVVIEDTARKISMSFNTKTRARVIRGPLGQPESGTQMAT